MTAASRSLEAAGRGAPERRVTYGSIVWGQLKKNRLAVAGLGCVAGLFAVAVYAPLLSLDQPFYVRSAETLRFPFFGALFNRLFFENAVDVFFNLAMVLSPLYALAFLALPRLAPGRFGDRRRLGLGLLAAHLLVFAAFVPERIGLADNPLYYTAPVHDWEARIAELEASGEDVGYAFPLRRYSYRATDPAQSIKPPSDAHWLGTDREGRDVFTRMLYGTRISLTIGVVAVSIYVAIGIVLGALAGYFAGWVDLLISRLIEVMICFPSFFLILTLAAFVEQRSIFHVMVIIGLTSWPGVARLVRAEFLKHKGLEYAQAARALGIPTRRIIFRHVLPNAMAPVLVAATFGVATAILVESSLSFLGVGDLSVPSWGETLNTGRLEGKSWLIFAPGFAIFFVVSVFNLVGEGLRDALDPKLRT